jgi:hypothetical protein
MQASFSQTYVTSVIGMSRKTAISTKIFARLVLSNSQGQGSCSRTPEIGRHFGITEVFLSNLNYKKGLDY